MKTIMNLSFNQIENLKAGNDTLGTFKMIEAFIYALAIMLCLPSGGLFAQVPETAPYPVGNPLGLPEYSTADGDFESISSNVKVYGCLLYTSPSPRDGLLYRMPSSA